MCIKLCKKELYGETADEKEVAQIIGKVKEAKGVKAYDTFEIIGKYVSQSHLLNMILPMKEVSQRTEIIWKKYLYFKCLIIYVFFKRYWHPLDPSR